MQIQASYVSTTSLYASIVSRLSSPVASPPETAPSPDPAPGAAGTVDASAPAPASEEPDPLRQALEDVFRARLDAPEEGEHEGRGNGAVARGLRDIRHAVKHELKDLAHALKGEGGVEREDDGDDDDGGGTKGVRDAIKGLGKEFDRTLKGLGRPEPSAAGADPSALLDSVRTAFDDLLTQLESLFGAPEQATPEPASSFRLEMSASRRIELTIDAAPPADSAPVAAVMPEVIEFQPPEPTAAEVDDGVGELADPAPDAALSDAFSRIRELLASLVDSFESLFAELETALGAPAPEAVEAPEEPEDTENTEEPVPAPGELEAVPADSVPGGSRFTLAISAYTSVRMELYGEYPGSSVNTAS